MVMNESVGILKSASSGNQGQMVIFYESCRIIKPNERDYFGRQICQTRRRLCKCENEDVSFQKPCVIISSQGLHCPIRKKSNIHTEVSYCNYIHARGLNILIMCGWSQIPEVPTV